MRESNKLLIFFIIAIISVVLFCIGYSDTGVNIMMLATLIMFANTLAYSLSCGNRMIIFSAFLVCLFTFVLGDWGVNFLLGRPWGEGFDRVTIRHVLICVYLSINSIFIGAVIGNIRSGKNSKKIDFKAYQKENEKFEGTIRILFYITMLFNILNVGNQVLFVQQNSYLALYTEKGYSMPYMVQKLAASSEFLFFAYLAILPKKEKAKKPIFLYFIVNAVSIFGGVRGIAVKATIIVLAYCFFRNVTDDDKWVKKKHILLLCIAAPVAIVLLSLYNVWRSGMVSNYKSFWDEFVNFFTTQGGSIKLIGYEKKFHNVLPATNVSYTFGQIINWYKYGFIGSTISMFTGHEYTFYSGNTIGSALYNNNLGATLTYLLMPQNYLAGVGLGTQYIAELYSDFGYWGIIVFNLFLGWFITKCRFVYFKRWYWNATTIAVVHILLGIGRDFATSFVSYYVSVANWLTVALVFGLSKVKLKKGERQNEDIMDL